MERKRGQTIRSEARNIIRQVIRKCDEEALKGVFLHPLNRATIRASDYVGVSTRTITRIRHEDSLCPEDEPLQEPGKKRPKSIENKFHCSEEDQQVIRNIIYEFYVEKKVVPTGPKLLEVIRQKIEFPWGLHSLRRLLHLMGYKWKKSNNIRRVLIEKPSIITWRAKYLKAIEYYRRENRNIIYVDEALVDNTLRFSKCWQYEGNELGVSKNVNSSHRLVIVHAGGKNGFVTGAELIFKSHTTTGDYYGQINVDIFEKWLNEKLIPNILANSVIIMDNAPYHSVQLNKPPSRYAKKEDMLKWMIENNIPHSSSSRKYELYDLIHRNKREVKTFKVDEILKLHGHNVLRLPPHMYDLNPFEYVWTQIKYKILENNTSILTIEELEQFANEAINEIKPSDWENYCKHVEKLEREYWQKDGLMEDATDNIQLDSDSSKTDSDSDESSIAEEL